MAFLLESREEVNAAMQSSASGRGIAHRCGQDEVVSCTDPRHRARETTWAMHAPSQADSAGIVVMLLRPRSLPWRLLLQPPTHASAPPARRSTVLRTR